MGWAGVGGEAGGGGGGGALTLFGRQGVLLLRLRLLQLGLIEAGDFSHVRLVCHLSGHNPGGRAQGRTRWVWVPPPPIGRLSTWHSKQPGSPKSQIRGWGWSGVAPSSFPNPQLRSPSQGVARKARGAPLQKARLLLLLLQLQQRAHSSRSLPGPRAPQLRRLTVKSR